MMISTTSLAISLLLMAPSTVHGHGYMFEPMARNYWSSLNGVTSGTTSGFPGREYCPHCLNTNTGVCGTSEQFINYDLWEDSTGQPMPWISQEAYTEGQVITVSMTLTAHHAGHMELKACPNGRASDQACFDANPLEFVDDIAFQMPKGELIIMHFGVIMKPCSSYPVCSSICPPSSCRSDNVYPNRGYFWGGSDKNGQDFSMRFRLPDSLVGEQILLQWMYITANSCSPKGYATYFGGGNERGEVLPTEFWYPTIPVCRADQFPPTFTVGDAPERFVNCAEVSVTSGNGNIPGPSGAPLTPMPTNIPVSAPTAMPVPAPTDMPMPLPVPTNMPVPNPTAMPVPVPTASPMSSPTGAPLATTGGGCCSLNFKECATWCNASQDQCENEPGCSNLIWLIDGSRSSDSCLPRWDTCSGQNEFNSDCCEGLVCRGDDEYKQCQHPDGEA